MSRQHDYRYDEKLEIASIFRGMDKKLNYVRKFANFSSDAADPLYEKYNDDISKIQNALRNLAPLETYIITQTFRTDGSICNSWWKGIYSKSSYYRARRKAAKSFLREYYGTDEE